MARDHRRLAAIVSLDVVGYSRLMGVDDSGTLAALKAHRRELIDPKISEHDGRIVKTTGDGLLLEFSSVVDAVRCAVEVQRGMAERNAGVASDKRLYFRIGINVGDIIIDGDDIFGDGVNVAARLEALADPGGICVSRVVRDQVLDKLSFAFEDLGPQEVKNIARPVDVYRVSLDVEAPAHAVPRPEQRPTRLAKRRWRPAHAMVAVTVVLVVGLGAWTGYRAFLRPAVVAPYSAQDRRMTFAVLPFQAPAEDKEGSQVAAAMTEAVQAVEEGNVVWAQVASRRSVEEAWTRHTSAKDLGSALNVHFLLRGNVTRVASGFNAEMLVVDATTERVLGTRSLAIAAGALTLRHRNDLKYALSNLTFYALEAEVQRARSKPVEALDVRDLSFRANVDWVKEKERKDEKGAYSSATVLLNRALALAPDDPLVLFMTAKVNLCDCVNAWSKNVEEQQAIGAAALEKYLRHDPDHPVMLELKSNLLALRGRYEESLLIVDSMLKRDPENTDALAMKAYALLKLGRPQEALTSLNEVFERGDENYELAAAVHYELAHYELSAQMAQKAIAQMDREDLSNPRMGGIGLTLVAAEARLGRLSRAKAALADFNAAVPGVLTIAAMKKWLHPAADLAGYEPLFDGLRLAGVSD
jgi:adenylate cyclase